MSRKPRRIRLSFEWLYLKIFEYMFYNQSETGFTRYHLTTKPNFGSEQRQDRIQEILDKMITFGHIKIVFETPSATYYHITEEGKSWYLEKGKEFQTFIKMLRE